MSGFHARRGRSNMARFLQTLNVVDPPPADDDLLLNDPDLSMWSNTTFYDFDKGQNTDFHAAVDNAGAADAAAPSSATTASNLDPFAQSIDFTDDFGFGDFQQPFTSPTLSNFADNVGSMALQAGTPMASGNTFPSQPALQPAPRQHDPQAARYGSLPQQQQQQRPTTANKRKADAMTPPELSESVDEQARVTAEEDKRRRNTAASARFRIKKKQREQALEQSNKDLTEEVAALKAKNHELETEIRWLKNLIVAKNSANTGDDGVAGRLGDGATPLADRVNGQANAAESGVKPEA